MTEDPIGFEGGINFLNYCSSSPINCIDPSGLAQLIERPGPIFGQPYTHAYIVFDKVRCEIGECSGRTRYNPITGGYSFGFWPVNPVVGIVPLPGIIHSPDPTIGDIGKHRRKKRNQDIAFELALCACIRDSALSPPWYFFSLFFGVFGYVCGSWTRDMWSCAKKKLGWDRQASGVALSIETECRYSPTIGGNTWG